jgi:N-acetylglucosamine-6-phosphate deacetylase
MEPAATGFFDPQVNGYGGVDFQRDGVTVEELTIATGAWRRDGGDSFLLTLITDAWPRLLARLRTLRGCRGRDPDLRSVIAGWHIEGPFLSDQPGFCGAHNPECMRDPALDDIHELREAAGDERVMLTIAPERRGAVEAIALAVKLGIRVSLGHTNATGSQLREAVSAGATGFTHLANGCPQQLDRHDNIIWRALDTPGLLIGLIADGIHVPPQLFRVIHRAVSPDRIYYTTDAMAAAGAPPGEYSLGRLRLNVGADGIVRQPGAANFAGSSLRPLQLRERAAAMLGAEADRMLSRTLDNGRVWAARISAA